MKKISAAEEEEEELSVTLICDGDIRIPDTAHQISTGILFLKLLIANLDLHFLIQFLNFIIVVFMQIRGFKWGLC